MKRIILKKWQSGHSPFGVGYKYLMKCLVCKKSFEISGGAFNNRKSNGTFCSHKCKGIYQTQTISPKKGKKYPHLAGENSGAWKGDNIGYDGMHRRVYRTLGKPIVCRFCGKKSSETKLNWANINHKYRWDLNDWVSLCISCHRQHDFKNNRKPTSKLGNNQFSKK